MKKGPLYVQVRQETEVLNIVDSLKKDLLTAKKILHELYAVRSEENKYLHEIQQRIKQMNQRIERIDEEILS